MKVWGMLRIKDEARWIDRVVRSIQPVTDSIVILDDHSTDGTPAICESLGCQVIRSEMRGIDETRDKDYLLGRVWDAGAETGDYCLMVDGDEALDPVSVPAIRQAIASQLECCSLHIAYLWDREEQVRTDRLYKEFRRPSLFKLTARGLTFRRTYYGGNFHCSSAPVQLLDRITPIPARLLHYGYLHREDRIRKYHWYNQVDPNNRLEDGYRHMVIGDLFPAESAFNWAGPLQLEALR